MLDTSEVAQLNVIRLLASIVQNELVPLTETQSTNIAKQLKDLTKHGKNLRIIKENNIFIENVSKPDSILVQPLRSLVSREKYKINN